MILRNCTPNRTRTVQYHSPLLRLLASASRNTNKKRTEPPTVLYSTGGTVFCTVSYRNSYALGNAYGMNSRES